MSDTKPIMSRRSLLKYTAIGAAGASVPVSGLLTAGPAAAHGTIVSHNEIWNQPTYYEVNGAAATFGYEPTFYARLETWLSFWYVNTPNSWVTPMRVYSYGAHYDGRASTAHNSGRGFDLTRIYSTVNGVLSLGFYGRYDVWRNYGSSLATYRKRYWATAASAHYHFRNVLTYAYNSEHYNHIHIDNLYSGSGNSSFTTSSTAQVKHAQACLTYIWGYPTTIDGIWGPQTSGNAAKALARMGRSGTLTTSQTNWLEFNRGSMRFGYGTQSY